MNHSAAENTYSGLGGYSFSFQLEEPFTPDFTDKINYILNDDAMTSFKSPMFVSAVAEILFYNKVTHAFMPVSFKVLKSPAGLVDFTFETLKPVGKLEESEYFGLLTTLEYVQVSMLLGYIFFEVV